MSVRCNKGFRLIGTNIISCGEDQEFVDLPECVDIDECANANPCDFSSTECVNTKVIVFILIVLKLSSLLINTKMYPCYNSWKIVLSVRNISFLNGCILSEF